MCKRTGFDISVWNPYHAASEQSQHFSKPNLLAFNMKMLLTDWSITWSLRASELLVAGFRPSFLCHCEQRAGLSKPQLFLQQMSSTTKHFWGSSKITRRKFMKVEPAFYYVLTGTWAILKKIYTHINFYCQYYGWSCIKYLMYHNSCHSI